MLQYSEKIYYHLKINRYKKISIVNMNSNTYKPISILVI